MNVSASRRTSGNRAFYEALEQELAAFFQAESAVLISSGYMTDLTVGQALTGQFTHAFLDARSHPALLDATRFLECKVRRFRHRDAQDCARQIQRAGRPSRLIILTDGMFGHNGSVAPLRAYARVLPPQGRMLVDDAHGAGVLGENGRGSAELEDVQDRRLIRTITLSKAFGVYGGAILGSAELRNAVIQRSRLFIGSTPLPPPLVHAVRESLRILRRRPALRRRVLSNTHRLRELIRAGGIPMLEMPGPVVEIRPSMADARAAIDQALLDQRILPPWIIYPGGVEGGYYRFAISAAHREEHLVAVARALLSCRGHWQ